MAEARRRYPQTILTDAFWAARDIALRMVADRAARAAGLVLTAGVLVFVLGYRYTRVHMPGSALDAALALHEDGSAAEVYGYALALIGAGALITAWWRTGVLTYAAGGLALLFVFADDAFQYHERAAGWLRARFDLPAPFGLRAQDTGELIAWAAAGFVLAALFAWAAAQRTGVTVRVLTLLGALAGGLGVFGVVMDFVHIRWERGLFTYVEDGGELMVLALFAWAAIAVARTPWRGALGEDAASQAWRGLRAGMGARTEPSSAHDPLRRPPRRPDLHA